MHRWKQRAHRGSLPEAQKSPPQGQHPHMSDTPPSRRTQLQEDTYFRVLRMLQDNPYLAQREIAQQLGVSTSGLND